MTQEQNAVKKNLRQDLDLILSQNPVLVTGLALAPAVVGSFTAKNGLGLSLVFAMVTIPVLVLASALSCPPTIFSVRRSTPVLRKFASNSNPQLPGLKSISKKS